MKNLKSLFFSAIFFIAITSYGQGGTVDSLLIKKTEADIKRLMVEGDIPGLNVVFVKGKQYTIRSYGFSSVGSQRPVLPETLFEINECRESFIALAITKLAALHLIDINQRVSYYLPWFRPQYKNEPAIVTVQQLLHHTSGISAHILSANDDINSVEAAKQLFVKTPGIKLNTLPGEVYSHSNINYDILTLIIQAVKQKDYINYLQEEVLDTLGLFNTIFEKPRKAALISSGYKIGFFNPRHFIAPAYRGKSFTAPLFSNAKSLAEWLVFQMTQGDSSLNYLQQTHTMDIKVPFHDMAGHGMGWSVSLKGDGKIYSEGMGPNYSSCMAFLPDSQAGVIVLANSNSNYTSVIATKCLNALADKRAEKVAIENDSSDTFYSMMSIIMGLFIFLLIGFAITVIIDVAKGSRQYAGITVQRISRLGWSAVILLPLLFAIYVYPYASSGFNWYNMFLWSPVSFKVMIILAVAALVITFIAYALNLFFPHHSKIRQLLPLVLLLSIVSGIANIAVITLVSNSLSSGLETKYLVFYYLLAAAVYILSRRFVQRALTKFSMEMIYDLRLELIDKIFATSYQNFETLDRGRVYTSLNNDILRLSEIAHTAVVFMGGIFTIVGGFVYLSLVSLWSTIVIIIVFGLISFIYYVVTQNTDKYFHRSRDSENVFVRYISGMIDGFKEISLHQKKKAEYKSDIAGAANEFRKNTTIANIRYIDVFIIGECLITLLLGVVVFVLPFFFKDIQRESIMSFIVILLYLIIPIDNVLNAIPSIMQLKIAKKRIDQFLKDIPANFDVQAPVPASKMVNVNSLRAEEITYTYKEEAEVHPFSVGPINVEVKAGEILFIIGGNGSGKTTLSKLLTGLYKPDGGTFFINEKPVHSSELGEYFSVCFSPAFLFEKLYNVNMANREAEIADYLKLLGLDEKVKIIGNRYNSIKLSGGQIKRLALFQCYLEDSPIYLFDEWAADQDPEYRNFFYRTLLPDMKQNGKIIIAITHDDHYFDVADKVLKMKMGKLEVADFETSAGLFLK
ncbi:MAG: cyclic peptide export ABC transporter [Ferruginibacter sp.]|nr:cyclic peptide export ABC transporter [Ferruginibacter sp.]